MQRTLSVSSGIEEQHAWAFWFLWRGGRDLVAHAARRAAQITEPPTGEAAETVIEINVGPDVERFVSVTEFLEFATADGVRKFSTVKIAVSGSEIGIHITIARRALEALPWLSEGVLLEVTGPRDRAREARDALIPTLSRGKLFSKRASRSGESDASLREFATERLAKQRQERWMRRASRAIPFVWTAFLIVFLVLTIDQRDAKSTAVAAIAGALVGLLVTPALVFVFPNVVITDISRSRLLINVASALPIGALVGLVAKALD
jgi:hypothetical protein